MRSDLSSRRLCEERNVTVMSTVTGCDETTVQHITRSQQAESEIISMDAGLRLDGIPALDSWDLIVGLLGNTNLSKNERETCL